jgi:hypothetical protein
MTLEGFGTAIHDDYLSLSKKMGAGFGNRAILGIMEAPITVFRSADLSAEEDAKAILELLAAKGIVGGVFDDKVPGIPSGAWEVRVEAPDRERAEAVIAANSMEDDDIDESHDLDLMTVFQSGGNFAEIEAMSVKSVLESNGLEAVIVGDSRWPNLPEEVRVAQEHVTEAKRLIAAALASGPSGAEEAERAEEAESQKKRDL